MKSFNCLSGLVLALVFIGVAVGQTDSDAYAPYCCRICRMSSACGATCISKDYECRILEACACNGETQPPFPPYFPPFIPYTGDIPLLPNIPPEVPAIPPAPPSLPPFPPCLPPMPPQLPPFPPWASGVNGKRMLLQNHNLPSSPDSSPPLPSYPFPPPPISPPDAPPSPAPKPPPCYNFPPLPPAPISPAGEETTETTETTTTTTSNGFGYIVNLVIRLLAPAPTPRHLLTSDCGNFTTEMLQTFENVVEGLSGLALTSTSEDCVNGEVEVELSSSSGSEEAASSAIGQVKSLISSGAITKSLPTNEEFESFPDVAIRVSAYKVYSMIGTMEDSDTSNGEDEDDSSSDPELHPIFWFFTAVVFISFLGLSFYAGYQYHKQQEASMEECTLLTDKTYNKYDPELVQML